MLLIDSKSMLIREKILLKLLTAADLLCKSNNVITLCKDYNYNLFSIKVLTEVSSELLTLLYKISHYIICYICGFLLSVTMFKAFLHHLMLYIIKKL